MGARKLDQFPRKVFTVLLWSRNPVIRQVFYFHFIWFIDSGCKTKNSQKSKLNYCTSQEPNGEKTRKAGSLKSKLNYCTSQEPHGQKTRKAGSLKSKLNYCTSQEPHGQKTGKAVSVLVVGEKPYHQWFHQTLPYLGLILGLNNRRK